MSIISKIKQIDVKLGGSYGTPLSAQLVAGAKTAAVATGITTAAKIPAVVSATVAAGAAVAKSAYKSVSSYAAANPIKTTVGGIFGIGVISQTSKPISAASKLPTTTFEAGQAVGKSIEEGSLKPIAGFSKEHPYYTAAVGAAATYTGAKGLSSIYSAYKLSNLDNALPKSGIGYEDTSKYYKEVADNIIKTTTEKTQDKIITADTSIPSGAGAIVPETTKTGTSPVPITPETQIMGKQAGTKSIGRGKSYKKPVPLVNRVTVNIMNQSRLTKKYIY